MPQTTPRTGVHIDAGFASNGDRMSSCGLVHKKLPVTRMYANVTCPRCKEIDEGKD